MTRGIPPQEVSISSAGLGSSSNNKGDSVGEDFSILCMPVIVLEERTLQVRVFEDSFQASRGTFEQHPWAETNLAARRAHHWCLVIDGSGPNHNPLT